MSQFKTVAIVVKQHDPRTAPTLRALARYLRQRHCEILVERRMAATGAAGVVSRAAMARHADLAVVVGGDGTLLNAGRTFAPAGVPVLGVNVGRLGFMVDVAPEDMRATLDEVLRGRFVRERRLLLTAEIVRGKRSHGPFLAINDVVIRSKATVRMLEFETWMDGEFISQHRADGIIVATPTGSTAYALSGDGPVLHPGLDAVVLVPICPHTLSDRPVVVQSDRTVKVVLGGAGHVRALCVFDGQVSKTLTPGDAVVITRSPHVLELIHPAGYRYFDILRNKLHWGRERGSPTR